MAGSSGEIRNKIVLEGEAQYKKALADINRTLRENKSETKAASLEYQNAGESMAPKPAAACGGREAGGAWGIARSGRNVRDYASSPDA